LGAAVLGNEVSRVYQLLLYKGKQQHVTSARISPSFQFVVSIVSIFFVTLGAAVGVLVLVSKNLNKVCTALEYWAGKDLTS
jgi:hypothetical protein